MVSESKVLGCLRKGNQRVDASAIGAIARKVLPGGILQTGPEVDRPKETRKYVKVESPSYTVHFLGPPSAKKGRATFADTHAKIKQLHVCGFLHSFIYLKIASMPR